MQIEVDAQAVAGSAGTLYGIMCRFNSPINTPTVNIPGKLYVFMVGSDGTYLVQYLAGGSTTLASGVAAIIKVSTAAIRVIKELPLLIA